MLFSAPMIRAELADEKTQTRRTNGLDFEDPDRAVLLSVRVVGDRTVATFGDSILDDPVPISIPCPYGKPGDTLWGKESWRAPRRCDHKKPSEIPIMTDVHFEADGPFIGHFGKLRPSIFMPRWVSRLDVAIVNIRVERLHYINEADAMAEGVDRLQRCADGTIRVHRGVGIANGCMGSARDAYRKLWESINGLGSWAIDPWVWVVEHRRMK